EAVVALALEHFGRLDVLISNAGVLSPNGRIHNLSTEDWERAFRVNVLGAVNAIRAAVPVMRTQRSGSIVLTASVSGLTAWSHAAPYCATKAAVIQLAKVAAVEYARDGIRVNCVCPGTFRSAIHADLQPEALDAIAVRHPLGLGSATDLVGAYSYLAGGAACGAARRARPSARGIRAGTPRRGPGSGGSHRATRFRAWSADATASPPPRRRDQRRASLRPSPDHGRRRGAPPSSRCSDRA